MWLECSRQGWSVTGKEVREMGSDRARKRGSVLGQWKAVEQSSGLSHLPFTMIILIIVWRVPWSGTIRKVQPLSL